MQAGLGADDGRLRRPRVSGKRRGHEPLERLASGWTPRRQASEQYRTRSQSRSHFLRQAKGREQATQTLVGRFDFFMENALVPGNRLGCPPARVP